jgi:hypothetical protein
MPTYRYPARVQIDQGFSIPLGPIAAAIVAGVVVAWIGQHATGIGQALAITTGAGAALSVAGAAWAIRLLRRDRGTVLVWRSRTTIAPAAVARRAVRQAPARPAIEAPPRTVLPTAILAPRETVQRGRS